MTMTFDQAYEKLDQLFESAMLSYEVEVITEATGEDGQGTDPKAKNFLAAAVAALKKLWAMIYESLVNLVKKAASIKVKQVTFPEGAHVASAKPDQVIGLINKFASSTSERMDDNREQLFEARLQKPMTVATAQALNDAKKLAVCAKKMTATAGATGDKDYAEACRALGMKVKAVVSDIYKAITAGVAAKAGAEKAAQAAAATEELKESAMNDKLTRMAKLLVEAANILSEEGEGEGTDNSVVADNITAGEVIQEPVDTIPEENPAEAADPAPEVSGGEGEKVDLEEIKELTGDDKEAIALMTEPEGGAVCESVKIDFGF